MRILAPARATRIISTGVTGFLAALLTVTWMVLMPGSARASAPSPEDLEKWEASEQERNARLERAKPWEAALDSALPAVPDSTRKLLFLITYKHQVQDSGRPAPKGLGSKALAFAKTWKAILKECGKAKLDGHALAEAIYRFTNSDWAPVSVARGPGLDKVVTPQDLRIWANAAISVGLNACKADMDPASVWLAQASSYAVTNPGDLKKVGLKPPPPRH